MRAALLVSGYLRNYEHSIKFIKNQLLEQFEQVDVYLHVTRNENKEDKYYNLINENVDFKKIVTILNPVSVLLEVNRHYNDNSILNATINQWNKLYKLNQLKKIQELSLDFKYDVVIRYRPDLSLNAKVDFNKATYHNTIIIPKDSKIDKLKLAQLNDSYVCDTFAYGPSTIMDDYFDIYKHLQNLYKQYGPVSETLLHNYLNDYSINYQLLDLDYKILLSKCNIFGICGDSGSGKTTLSNLLKVFFSNSFTLEGDRYHKWERGDLNWKSYTHLNPEANYIAKMSEDIFNLKIGNSIYQVDYDHKTGKFTESELINPTENTIVCGLHSLYCKDDTLYDLKIFMDTDEALKTKWKVDRDVHERGYTMEKVLNQISARRDDYEKYIHSQRDKSDIIINFYPISDDVALRILFSKKYDIFEFTKVLDLHGVTYELDVSEKGFIGIVFKVYKNVYLWNDSRIPHLGNFYDYIVYFILNLELIQNKNK
jgi:uridine kinase